MLCFCVFGLSLAFLTFLWMSVPTLILLLSRVDMLEKIIDRLVQ